MKIGELKAGDVVAVRWYQGQSPVVGTVILPVPHASRASGTHIRLANGQTMRIKASMKIEQA